jgi:hypothetical protein
MLVLFLKKKKRLVLVLVRRFKTPKCRKLELLLQKQIYYKGLTIEFSVKSPCLHPIFWPAFTPYPLFQWYVQSKEILLNLSMKC